MTDPTSPTPLYPLGTVGPRRRDVEQGTQAADAVPIVLSDRRDGLNSYCQRHVPYSTWGGVKCCGRPVSVAGALLCPECGGPKAEEPVRCPLWVPSSAPLWLRPCREPASPGHSCSGLTLEDVALASRGFVDLPAPQEAARPDACGHSSPPGGAALDEPGVARRCPEKLDGSDGPTPTRDMAGTAPALPAAPLIKAYCNKLPAPLYCWLELGHDGLCDKRLLGGDPSLPDADTSGPREAPDPKRSGSYEPESPGGQPKPITPLLDKLLGLTATEIIDALESQSEGDSKLLYDLLVRLIARLEEETDALHDVLGAAREEQS